MHFHDIGFLTFALILQRVKHFWIPCLIFLSSVDIYSYLCYDLTTDWFPGRCKKTSTERFS